MRSVNTFGVLAASALVTFGAVNLASPMDLRLFQATCGKLVFFPCGIPPQELTDIGARVFGAISVAIGLGVGWLAWQPGRGAPVGHSSGRAASARRQAPSWISATNLVLRFLLELTALLSLGIWGAHAGGTDALAVILAVVAPLAAALLWGMFVAPKARIRVAAPLRLAIELAIFGAAVAGLAALGFTKPAAALAIAVALHEGWRAAEFCRSGR